jgi:RNA polymerase sigma-70 factor (ECF subfamily)
VKTFSTEQELMAALHRGDRRANDQLYQDTIRQLCYYIETVTGDNIAVEDIAAESMVKGFARIKDFSDVTTFKYFVFRIAKNAAIDYLRSRVVRSRAVNQMEQLPAETPGDFDRHYIYSHALNVIYQEIAELPPQVKEIVTRNLIDGQPLSEIAVQMNLAYKTVHNRAAFLR